MDAYENLPTAKQPMTIDIVSDAVCPWCFVGKRKLEAALATLPRVAATIHWRPYQLDPTIPSGGLDRRDYMIKKFGAERAGRVNEHLVEAGRSVGLDFAFDKIKRSPNTLDAHRLIRWGFEAGRQTELVERLFALYFQEGGDIGDHKLLAEAAMQAGMDGDAIRQKLDGDDDCQAVVNEIEAARRIGVTGVPFFIFGGTFGVPGAQSSEVLAAAIRDALKPPPQNAVA